MGKINLGPKNKSHNLAQYTVRQQRWSPTDCVRAAQIHQTIGPVPVPPVKTGWCVQPQSVTWVVLMVVKGPAGSTSILILSGEYQQSVFAIWRQNCNQTVHRPCGCCLSRTTTATWGCWECLASLLLSLADNRGVFSISGVRGTGKASARGSQHTNNSKWRARHLQVNRKNAKNYRRLKMHF